MGGQIYIGGDVVKRDERVLQKWKMTTDGKTLAIIHKVSAACL